MTRAEAERLPREADGRTPGRRGTVTRDRLLAATAEMLEEGSYRNITVTEIAGRARTSPATYYQYFHDVEGAVSALAEAVAADGERLFEPLRASSWRGIAGWHSAEAVVDAFLEFWRDHGSVLRVVDLLSLEGDERLRAVRVQMLHVVTRALAAVIESAASQSSARAPAADPAGMASVLTSMLAHVASHQDRYQDWDIGILSIRDAAIDLLYWGITNPAVPRHTRPAQTPKSWRTRATAAQRNR